MKQTLVTVPLILLLAPLASADSVTPDDPWPISKGTKWVYEGSVTYMVPQKSNTAAPIEKTETVRLSSEVKDAFKNDSYSAAWMHGSLEDFCWYTPAQQPKDWLLLKLGTDYYTLRPGDVPGTFAKLKAAGSDTRAVYDDLNAARLYLPTPLAVDKRFPDGDSGAANLARQWYCWIVDSATPFDTQGLKGLPTSFRGTSYTISCRTNPDYMEESFVPGIGMVGLHYHHNGTPMDVDARLVELDRL